MNFGYIFKIALLSLAHLSKFRSTPTNDFYTFQFQLCGDHLKDFLDPNVLTIVNYVPRAISVVLRYICCFVNRYIAEVHELNRDPKIRLRPKKYAYAIFSSNIDLIEDIMNRPFNINFIFNLFEVSCVNGESYFLFIQGCNLNVCLHLKLPWPKIQLLIQLCEYEITKKNHR